MNRLAEEVKDLAKHGVTIKPELQGETRAPAIRLFLIMCFFIDKILLLDTSGLLADQIKELKLVDEFEEQCVPSGGFAFEADPVQRRNGRAPVKV